MDPDDLETFHLETPKEAACHAVFSKAVRIWELEGKSALTAGQLTVLCVERFVGETCNGGLMQFFVYNFALANDAVHALQRVGLDYCAQLLKRACARFPAGVVPDVEDRFLTDMRTLLDQSDDEPFDDVETEFFAWFELGEVEFRDKLLAYIIEHHNEFVC